MASRPLASRLALGRLWSSASSQGVRQLAAPRLHHAQVRHRVALVQRAAAQLEEADLFTARGVKRRCSHQPRSFRKLSWRSVSCAVWCVCRCGVAFIFCLSSTPTAPVSESAGRVSNYRSARRCAACRPPSRGSGGRCLRTCLGRVVDVSWRGRGVVQVSGAPSSHHWKVLASPGGTCQGRVVDTPRKRRWKGLGARPWPS